MLPKQPNQSLIDGLACLQAITAAPGGVREVARMLEMETTRVHRLLRTLAHLGLAEQDGERRYRAGPGMQVLAAMSLYGSGLMRRALGPLEKLRQTKLVVALGVRWLDQVAYVYHAGPGVGLAEGFGRTPPFPAAQSGLGVALLAAMEDKAVRELYRSRDVGRRGGVTGLLEQLAKTREEGFADVTREDGQRTIAAAVVEALGPPTVAVGVAGRIPNSWVTELAVKVIRAGRDIAEGR